MMNRRDLLKKARLTALISPFAAFGYGRFIERHWFEVTQLEVRLRGLGSAWDGFTIVHLSDLHLEPHIYPEQMAAAVQTILALKPGMVAITGDFVTDDANTFEALAEPLRGLKADAGVFFCHGNHDVWTQPERIARALAALGFTHLDNTGLGLTRQNEPLWIAGLESAWAGRPNLAAATKGRPANAPCITLVHEPDYADILSQAPLNQLQLSGHTHGGQVCLPFGIPLILPNWGKKYAKGHFHLGRHQLYVNRGLGTLGPDARFACRPEITEITLRSA